MGGNFLEVDGERLWESLEASGRIGNYRDTGLRRLALTPEDKEMRDLFVSWCRDAGCEVEVDQLGNIFATRAGTEPSLAPVACGSHLDTQANGGKYDGILGVLSGLEVLRTLNDKGLETKRAIKVIAWSNEEGARFNPPMGPAMAFVGQIPLENILQTLDADGISYAEALRTIGYDGDPQAGQGDYDSYFEIHIEQGPELDQSDVDVGIVTGGYHYRGMKLEIHGQTAHAGPTAMDVRHNALVGAGLVIAGLNRIGWKYHPEKGKSTSTRIACEPNLAGIVPELCQLSIDFRHPTAAGAAAMYEDVKALLVEAARESQTRIEVDDTWTFGESIFDDDCMNLLKATADDLGEKYVEIRSQAGHDAYAMAYKAPVAMIFTPCKDGISHSSNEEIELARTLPGVNVFLNALVDRANR